MSRTRIVFRADGGPTIGMGHFVRTLALADMLKDDFLCTYVTREPTAWQVRAMEDACHNWIGLPADEGHFDVFLSYLRGDEIVVLDNYYFDTSYQRAIKDRGSKLVCIDDLHDKHFVADMVINHAAGVTSDAYSAESYTKLMLGYSYAMLRREFLGERRGEERKRYSVLVIMGGATPGDIAHAVVQAACSRAWDLPVALVSAAAQRQITDDLGGGRAFGRLSARDVSQLMREAVVAVLPASTVAIEACAIGLPFISGYFVPNQHEIHDGLRDYGLAVTIGDFTAITADRMAAAIADLMTDEHVRREMIRNQQKHLDRRSPSRLLKAFRDLCR